MGGCNMHEDAGYKMLYALVQAKYGGMWHELCPSHLSLPVSPLHPLPPPGLAASVDDTDCGAVMCVGVRAEDVCAPVFCEGVVH